LSGKNNHYPKDYSYDYAQEQIRPRLNEVIWRIPGREGASRLSAPPRMWLLPPRSCNWSNRSGN